MKAGDIFAEDEAKHFLLFLLACLDPRDRNLNPLLVSPLCGKTDAAMKELSDAERVEHFERFNRLGRRRCLRTTR